MSEPERLPDRTVIRISGDERTSFLQGLITQDMDALSPHAPIFAALLTPQGKILFDFFVIEDGGALLIDCDREAAPALVKRLTLYKLRAKVAIETDETLNVLASAAPFETERGPAWPDPRLAALGWRAVSAGPASGDGGFYNRRRLALGAPEFGKDFPSDKMFLMDVNYDALSAVSYQKGCFVGQEVASRMKRKGEARKRTLIIEFDGAPPDPGTPVTAGASTLGEIFSADEGRALAMIRLDRWKKAETDGAMSAVNGREARLSVPDYLEQD